MEGLRAVGKTTAAVALTRHVGVRHHFKDGVLFVSLGPHGDATSALLYWAKALGTDTANLARPTQLSQAVKDSIGQRRMLLVIDDVWDLDAARCLRCGGPNCVHLVTTRDRAVAHAFAGTDRTFPLPTLDDAQAYQMLQASAPEACAANPARVQSLLRAVGGLPLAVSLMGGYLSGPERSLYAELFPDLSEKALAEMSEPLRRLQLAEKRLGVPGGESETLEDTIALSLEELPDHMQQVFYALI
jgi:NB-ARC domain